MWGSLSVTSFVVKVGVSKLHRQVWWDEKSVTWIGSVPSPDLLSNIVLPSTIQSTITPCSQTIWVVVNNRLESYSLWWDISYTVVGLDPPPPPRRAALDLVVYTIVCVQLVRRGPYIPLGDTKLKYSSCDPYIYLPTGIAERSLTALICRRWVWVHVMILSWMKSCIVGSI